MDWQLVGRLFFGVRVVKLLVNLPKLVTLLDAAFYPSASKNLCQYPSSDQTRYWNGCGIATALQTLMALRSYSDLRNLTYRAPGYENAAGKLSQKWQATAGPKFTKPGARLILEPWGVIQ